ncbi:MAG: hypothetical protein QM571_03340 [Micrococcaceae bacterium]
MKKYRLTDAAVKHGIATQQLDEVMLNNRKYVGYGIDKYDEIGLHYIGRDNEGNDYDIIIVDKGDYNLITHAMPMESKEI